jgi:hypothetical protein
MVRKAGGYWEARMAQSEGGISRRNVILGATWSAPVILIATAVPAAAASEAVAGAVGLTGLAATMVESNFRVLGAVTYVDPSPDPDLPVTNVTLAVQFPSDRVSPGSAQAVSTQWEYLNRIDAGGVSTFRFQWLGADLLPGPTSVTAPLEAIFPKTVSLEPLSATFIAGGFSDGSPVSPVSQPVPVLVGANLVLNSEGASIRYQQTGGINQFQYAFDGTTRWAGPYWPIGATATGIKVTARIPTANSTGAFTEQFRGNGWSAPTGPTVVNGNYEVSYTYTPDLTADFQTTSTLQFALGTVLPGVINIATLRTEGQASGITASDQRVGPASLALADWDPTERHADGGWGNRPVGEGAGG